eukprot:gene10978-biopygen11024
MSCDAKLTKPKVLSPNRGSFFVHADVISPNFENFSFSSVASMSTISLTYTLVKLAFSAASLCARRMNGPTNSFESWSRIPLSSSTAFRAASSPS